MKFSYKLFNNMYRRNYQKTQVIMPIFIGYSTYYYNKNQ